MPDADMEHELSCPECGCIFVALTSEAEDTCSVGTLTFTCPQPGCGNPMLSGKINGKWKQVF